MDGNGRSSTAGAAEAATKPPEPRGSLAPRRGHYALKVVMGSTPGSLLALGPGESVLGRGATATLRIVDPSMSREHARLVVGPAGVTMRDLGSANGTFVECERLEAPTLLRDGDRITLGDTVLRFVAMDDRERTAELSLKQSMVRDPLTGLYNRSVFDSYLASELAYAARHRTPVAVMLVDIDHFKRVNDDFGHPVGDEVLRKTAQALASMVRAEDLVARYGGEEFGVVARGVDDGAMRILTERIRTQIEHQSFEVQGRELRVTVSIGVAVTMPDKVVKTTSEQLLTAADEALYTSKRQGRNRVSFA